jgi:ribosomal protein S18 acetylase RimI-like enzyme
VPVGSVIVGRGGAEIRLIDIAFLIEHRNRGYGTEVISDLMEESAAAAVPLRLSVARGNRALRLYERLGFAVTQTDAVYIEMEYRSGVPEPK